MKNIVTCLSSKDLITYSVQSRIYNNPDFKIYLIGTDFTLFVVKVVNYFRKTKCKYVYVNETFLLKQLGIKDFKNLIAGVNPGLLKKTNWYKQQFFKYEISNLIKDDYTIVDGDTFPTNIENLRELDKRVRFVNTYTPIHQPYEELYNCLFDSSGMSVRNFVCEIFQINYLDLMQLIHQIESKFKKKWYLAVLENVTHPIGFSEYQTFARYTLENDREMIYKNFNTQRNFGIRQLPFCKIKTFDTEFVSFETYDIPSGYQGVIFYLLIKPYVKFSQIFRL